MQFLHAVTLVVPDYDPAIEFYCDTLGWQLAEDVDQGRKRWVRILPPGASQEEQPGDAQPQSWPQRPPPPARG